MGCNRLAIFLLKYRTYCSANGYSYADADGYVVHGHSNSGSDARTYRDSRTYLIHFLTGSSGLHAEIISEGNGRRLSNAYQTYWCNPVKLQLSARREPWCANACTHLMSIRHIRYPSGSSCSAKTWRLFSMACATLSSVEKMPIGRTKLAFSYFSST